MAFTIKFFRLWVRYREDIINLLREILKIMAPEQEQPRWRKGVASVLYTYAIVSYRSLQLYAIILII